MKLKNIIFTIMLGVVVLSINSFVYAGEKGSKKGLLSDGAMTASVTETGAIKVGNKICPISKEKIGEMGEVVEYEHEGKVYNLCCKMCLKDFKKDPEKYIKMIEGSLDEKVFVHKGSSHEGHEHE